jgi:hypothetical protein
MNFLILNMKCNFQKVFQAIIILFLMVFLCLYDGNLNPSRITFCKIKRTSTQNSLKWSFNEGLHGEENFVLFEKVKYGISISLLLS